MSVVALTFIAVIHTHTRYSEEDDVLPKRLK
jgi:hypothetical protein